MYENTLFRALTKYRIHIHIGNNFSDRQIEIICSKLDACENYLNQGNKITGTWLAENRDILSKVVEYAHDIVHEEAKGNSANVELQEEHQDLNKFVSLFKELK